MESGAWLIPLSVRASDLIRAACISQARRWEQRTQLAGQACCSRLQG
jgi:hypothetical protein